MITTHTPLGSLGRRDRDHDESAALTIEVGTATGTGATEIAAFDAALRELGVGEANLVRLSSVIPPRARIQRTPRVRRRIGWGDRLYCVYALAHTRTPDTTAAAGIGWALRADGSGAGLFVEHVAETPAQVEDLIHASLAEMTAARPGRFGPVHSATIQTRSDGRSACALALAAYEATGWGRPA
ncbi:pyruvoyl-dependent arginine decarboxylase [Nocardia veterana]|uniref:Pyruvoyl-dependent arginine decarboxylase AaxB n=1 Tax=Nocardia veterana TaxID=132249 RepID=A0A7X6LZ98_9NOCA|nr:pyruvoyl-dependent arginine decarboxylase [Nocardia veterana]NKY87281.1 pyruvoyl-dependent arginine decarboxylase [Nocardia veterana]